MKKAFGLIFALTALMTAFSPAKAQPPVTLWTRTYGGSDVDGGYSVQQTTDGGYILAGYTYSFSPPWEGGDVYLVKTNAIGDTLWTKVIGSACADWAKEVQQTSDGGYIVVGGSWAWGTGFGPPDVYLIKTDANGNTQWTRYYGGSESDDGSSVEQTTDGGYILTGYSYSYPSGIFLLKTDAAGDSLWSNSFGGWATPFGPDVQPTTDGGYILVGTYNPWSISTDMLLIKTNGTGDTLWTRIYGGPAPANEIGLSVQQTTDGGYILVGFAYEDNYNADVYVVKTDADGDTLWTKRCGGLLDDYGYSVQQTSDGSYLVAGTSSSYGAGEADFYLIKMDAFGNTLWTKTFGGSAADEGYCVQQTTDGGFILAGLTYSYGAGGSDVYLLKTDAGGGLLVTIDLDPVNPPIQIPASGGSFNFNAVLTNTQTAPQTFDVWIMVELPSGPWYGPVLGPLTLTLPGGASLTRLRTQSVPGSAPAGDYLYEGRVGDYPNTIWDQDGFLFTKQGLDDDGPISDWLNSGESFDENGQSTPNHFDLAVSVSPNPCNPTATISFQLPTAGLVDLSVYDLSGRPVAELVNGWREAGDHEMTFDGSGLASGIYLYCLKVGEHVTSGKMTLLK